MYSSKPINNSPGPVPPPGPFGYPPFPFGLPGPPEICFDN